MVGGAKGDARFASSSAMRGFAYATHPILILRA